MTDTANRRIVLASRPTGLPTASDFRIEDVPRPALADGQVLVRVALAGVAPWQGQRLKDVRSYVAPFDIGALIASDVVGQVVESHADAYPVGTFVAGRLGWQELIAASPTALTPIEPGPPLSAWLSVLGSPGLTAYFALTEFGRPRPGDTVAITSAAGAVGSLAVQIAKVMGARVIGIAGGEQKCRFVARELGADVAVDYRAPDYSERLKKACPNGVDVFFDNVGGPVADAVLERLAKYATVVLVGRTAANNSDSPSEDFANMRYVWVREATVKSFSLYAYASRLSEGRERLASLLWEGRIAAHDTVLDGFETAPAALCAMLAGAYTGKVLVRFRQPEAG